MKIFAHLVAISLLGTMGFGAAISVSAAMPGMMMLNGKNSVIHVLAKVTKNIR